MTLDTTQSHVGSTSLLTDIQNIIINFMSKSNFRAALDAAVTYNVQKCRNNIYCDQAFYQPMPYRRELLRQTAGFMNLLLDSGIWQFLGFINVLWGSYAVACGTCLFLIRSRSICKKRKKFACTSLICGMFTSLDQALNPLSLSKLDQKYRMKGVEEQITLQGNQAKLYNANIKIALARVGILEKENGILSSELKEIRAILSKSASLKARVLLLEQLSSDNQSKNVGT